MYIDTITIKGYEVEILADDWQENPREWDCISSTLVTAHKRYAFGGVELTYYASSIEDAFQQHLSDEGLSEKDIIYLEVFIYEHGGIAISSAPFGCRWDSGQLGFIYENRSEIREEFGVKRISPKLEQRIFARMDSELALLEYWINGDVYAFSVDDEVCGGFYGRDHEESGLIAEATATVDAICRHHTEFDRCVT